MGREARAGIAEMGMIRMSLPEPPLTDWRQGERVREHRAGLREVPDGGCRLFRAVLSPDYNDAHRDRFTSTGAVRPLPSGEVARAIDSPNFRRSRQRE